VLANEGTVCARCDQAFHLECQPQHDCIEKTTPPPAPPAKKTAFYWGPILGVVLAAGLSPVISRWRDRTFLVEKAAKDLHCAPEQVTIETHRNAILAHGCDDSIEYLRLCSNIRLDECLQLSSPSKNEVNSLIRQRLGQ